MTEAEWLEAKHPYDLIYHKSCRSNRKRRLLACACARRVLDFLRDGVFEPAVGVSERYADGLATDADLRAARRELGKFLKGPEAAQFLEHQHHAARAAGAVLEKQFMSFKMAIELTAAAQAAKARPNWDAAHQRETRAQVALARDIFANPFRAVALDPAWLHWNGGTIPRMAEAIYAELRFADLPVLADALEEAGCMNSDILPHCRGPGPHVPGCWVVDVLLDKQ
jgi:hypothetical protein